MADLLDRGFIGSTIGGVAIGPDGKVVGLDKNGKPTGAGVVATADGKVMRDPNTNRTVFADSQGNMYTSGLFGMNKKNLDGTAYKGPGDAKTAPVTNTVAAQPAFKPAFKSVFKPVSTTSNDRNDPAPTTTKKETISQKISRGGGFAKGGLMTKKKGK